MEKVGQIGESTFLPRGGVTRREREVANMLLDAIEKHLSSPEISGGGSLPRSSIDAAGLSAKDLERAGFVPSYVAVPEQGQSMWRTYRHPMNGIHFHKHGDRWLFHRDTHASFQMLMKRYRMSHPDASLGDVIRYAIKHAVPDSASHVLHEGTPGYIQWVDNVIQGKPGFLGGKNPSFGRRARGVGAVFGGAMAANKAVTGEWRPETAAGTVGGFIGFKALADRMGKAMKTSPPGWKNTLIRAGIPIVGTIASTIAGNRLHDRLSGRKEASAESAKEYGLKGALIGGSLGAGVGGRIGSLAELAKSIREQRQEYDFSTEFGKPKKFRPSWKRSGKAALKGYIKYAVKAGLPAAAVFGAIGAVYGAFQKKGNDMKSTGNKNLADRLYKIAGVKRAGVTKGILTTLKGLGQVGKGFGQIGTGAVSSGWRGLRRAGSVGSRYAGLLSGSRGSALDRQVYQLAKQHAPYAAIDDAVRAARSEWRKVMATRLATLAGLGAGGAYVASDEGLE